jgi:hypothetical protein
MHQDAGEAAAAYRQTGLQGGHITQWWQAVAVVASCATT